MIITKEMPPSGMGIGSISEYTRKNGDTSTTPEPRNERTPEQDKRSGLVIPYHFVGPFNLQGQLIL
jgi:hypothetical protein